MNYPTSYDSLTQPTPTTIRSATGGVSPANTAADLIKISQLLESKLGLNAFTVFTANATTDVFTSNAHKLNSGDVVIVKSTGSLPPELAINTRYFVITATANTFQLTITSGGAAINISANGSGTHTFAVLIAAGKALVGAANGTSGYTSSMPAGAVVGDTDAQTLFAKTLIKPTIASFENATHTHQNVAGGGQLELAALTTVARQSLVPTGALMPYAATTPPDGWVLCYGQAISRATYAVLFAVVGVLYGVGDGSSTFNVPDLRGRTVAGQDDMGGTSADRLTGLTGGVDGDVLAATGGEQAHILLTAEMPSHTHSWNSGQASAGPGATTGVALNNAGFNIAGPSTSAGSDGAHNNVQPTIILNYILKV